MGHKARDSRAVLLEGPPLGALLVLAWPLLGVIPRPFSPGAVTGLLLGLLPGALLGPIFGHSVECCDSRTVLLEGPSLEALLVLIAGPLLGAILRPSLGAVTALLLRVWWCCFCCVKSQKSCVAI